MRVPVPWVFVLTYLAGAWLELGLPARTVPGAGLEVVGSVLLAVGAVVAGWALLVFRRARTTTVPGKRSSRLVTWGPYRVSRNPMYVGLVTAYLGEAALLRQIWPIVLLPLTVAYLNWIVIPVEESRLLEVFGRDYERYRGSVGRWF